MRKSTPFNPPDDCYSNVAEENQLTQTEIRKRQKRGVFSAGTWWHCYAKQSAEESTVEIATVASAAGAIGSAQHAWQAQVEVPQLTGPVKSNVSSGVFGMGFVEAPAIFKRKGIYCERQQ